MVASVGRGVSAPCFCVSGVWGTAYVVPSPMCPFVAGGTDVVEAFLDRVTDWRLHRLELSRRRAIGAGGWLPARFDGTTDARGAG